MKPIVREYDKRIYKKCIKCRGWKPREDILTKDGDVQLKHGFGKHSDASDGLQAICFLCKNDANNKARNRDIRVRIRHHTATRCLTQLGKKHTPKGFVKDLETHLGYKIPTLVRHLSKDLREREGKHRKLRDALNEGYHIDHIRPLSLYKVVVGAGTPDAFVDWKEFRKCWAIKNLTAIPGIENLQKGAKFEKEEEKE